MDEKQGIRVERPLPVEGQAARITELWAWCAIDPMTDTEGIISAKLRDGGALPLVASMREVAVAMTPLAEAVTAAAQEPRPTVRLRHFIAADK